MTMHTEQSAIRSAGYSFADLFALIEAKYRTWRAQRIERAAIEALQALGPEILEDIGVRILDADKPAGFIPVLNPYAIVAAAVFAPGRREREEI